MKMLKVHNGFVALQKVTGIYAETNKGILPYPVVVTTENGKYHFSEGYTPLGEPSSKVLENPAEQERLRAYISRYILENTVELGEGVSSGRSCGQSFSCGTSHSCKDDVSTGRPFENDGGSEAFNAAKARHEEFKKKAEENRKKFDEREQFRRKKMKELGDVIAIIEQALNSSRRL